MTSSWVVNGGRPLAGEVQISGFKHAALPLVAAGMLASGPFELANVPDVEDVRVIAELLVHAGASARHDRAGRRLLVDPTTISNGTLPSALTRRVHGSLYMVPGLLGKLGEVHAGPFGGCRIGEASAGESVPSSTSGKCCKDLAPLRKSRAGCSLPHASNYAAAPSTWLTLPRNCPMAGD
ncbi:hypothetical protein HB777_36525 (plasmid) [Mesorhizobium loti]|nr:hypothetical protein HB777_36525 [Mesorhizobium loti]